MKKLAGVSEATKSSLFVVFADIGGVVPSGSGSEKVRSSDWSFQGRFHPGYLLFGFVVHGVVVFPRVQTRRRIAALLGLK